MISAFCQWAHDGGVPVEARSKFPRALRRCIADLPARDADEVILVRDLVGSEGLRCGATVPGIYIAPGGERSRLTAAVCAPSWGTGWRRVVKHEELYSALSWFFYFAAQYVSRGRALAAAYSVHSTYGRVCDFRGHQQRTILLTESTPLRSREEALAHAEFTPAPAPAIGRSRQVAATLGLVNPLDPYVHRALFQHLRALQLLEGGFAEEATLALDCVVAVAKEFAQVRLGDANSDPRGGLDGSLGIAFETQVHIELLYGLRCAFGGHPAKSKWWDFHEIYGDYLAALFEAVAEVVRALLRAERANREVEPNPSSWSKWFDKNAMVLWEAVWFAKLPC